MRTAVSLSSIDCEAATAALQGAVRHAEGLGIRINVGMVDAGGNLAGFLRMPGAFLHSIDIAIDKAYTAVGFGLATSALAAALKSHSPAVQTGLVLRPRLVAFAGGLPARLEGQLIGAIGVSGGSEDDDRACAQAGGTAALGA